MLFLVLELTRVTLAKSWETFSRSPLIESFLSPRMNFCYAPGLKLLYIRIITEVNPACTWRFNPEYWGAIHSTKIPTGPTGKIGPPQKVDPFFRNFSGWTEPIHWVLDRNFRKFWLNGSRPWRLDSKIRFPATARRGWPRFKADAYLEKKNCSHWFSISLVMQLAMAVIAV